MTPKKTVRTGHDSAAMLPKFAIVRLSTFDEAGLARGAADMGEFQTLHASQPGYAGSITVDIGSGRRLAVNLWESEETANAARENLLSAIDVLLGGVLTGSSLVGAGPVVDMDIPVVAIPSNSHEEQR